MKASRSVAIVMIATLALMSPGCDENKRLAEQAERHAIRQSEQNVRMAEAQHEIAEGSRRLVEADAAAREEMVALQREVQTERVDVGRQRDLLESDRRQIAEQRYSDPIIADAITQVGLLVACILPLIVCWQLLRRPTEPADESAVAELLLRDLMAENPILGFPAPNRLPFDAAVHQIEAHPEAGANENDSRHSERKTHVTHRDHQDGRP